MSSHDREYVGGSSAETSEAQARRQLNEARKKNEGATAEVKQAVEAEAAAKAAVGQTRDKARRALTQLNKAKDAQTKADQALEQTRKRLADEESKSATAREKGKSCDDTRVKEARLDEVSAKEAASAAAIDSWKASLAQEGADKAANEAEEALKAASARVAQARTDEQSAKEGLREAEDKVKQTVKEAKRGSKSSRKEEVATVREPEARRVIDASEHQSSAVATPEAAPEAVSRSSRTVQGDGGPSVAAGGDLYSGTVSVFVTRPVTFDRLLRFQESLQNTNVLAVRSIGGSAAEGPKLVISIERQVPLLALLSDIPMVDQVSQRPKARAIEVRLK